MARRRPAARPTRKPPPKRRSSASPPRHGGSGLPGWAWAIVGLCVGGFVATVFLLGRQKPNEKTASHSAPVNRTQAAKAKANAPVPVPPKQPAEFSFYRLLPSHEVVITPSEARRAEKAEANHGKVAADVSEPGSYFVQVGAYRSRQQADSAKARIALLGVESHVEQVTLASNDIWYRVRVGPEPTLNKAQLVINRLKTNGVKSLLVKQND